MLYVTLALLGIVILLTVLRERDARQFERLLAATAAERRSLLDRIQHPERAQVAPVEREPIEPPRDSAELAYVGQIVPEGVHVGASDGN
jgi:hypothetical protein